MVFLNSCCFPQELPEAKSPHLKQWGWFRWVSFWGPGLLPGAVLINFDQRRWFCIHFEEFLLLMEEILHHLGCTKILYFNFSIKMWCVFFSSFPPKTLSEKHMGVFFLRCCITVSWFWKLIDAPADSWLDPSSKNIGQTANMWSKKSTVW